MKNTIQDKCLGSLIGGAIGDAFGYPVEFVNSFEEIRAKFGDEGIIEYDKSYPWLEDYLRHYKALLSDDTQMTLYTAEGIIEATKNGRPLMPTICNAYIAWYGPQIGKKVRISYDSKLAEIEELNQRRAPGNTCLSSLNLIYCGKEPHNTSKGCGGIMRIAPIGIFGATHSWALENTGRIAGEAAEITHQLARYEYKDKLPGSYYRLNGLSTIYLNVYVEPEASRISLSHHLTEKIAEVESVLREGVYMELTYNAAEKQETELRILVRRSLMSLLILLAFVWAIRRRWKYLFITTVTLAANILIAVLVYYLAGMRLHTFALAGITVSLIVALLFVPALIEYGKGSDNSDQSDNSDDSDQSDPSEKSRKLSAYTSYIRFAQRFRWLLIALLVLAFGIPFFALPDKLGEKEKEELEWYESLYNSTLGSDFFVRTCKPAMSEWLGGTMRLFAEHINGDRSRRSGNYEAKKLHIRGKMPVGGSIGGLLFSHLAYILVMPVVIKLKTKSITKTNI